MARGAGFIPFLIWFASILYLSFMPLTGWPKLGAFEKLYGDKLIHLVMYCVLCWLLALGISIREKGRPLRRTAAAYSILICSAIGITIEILQPMLTQFRHFELPDMIANVIGSAAGAFIYFRTQNLPWVQRTINLFS
jgi:VanZ family protein